MQKGSENNCWRFFARKTQALVGQSQDRVIKFTSVFFFSSRWFGASVSCLSWGEFVLMQRDPAASSRVSGCLGLREIWEANTPSSWWLASARSDKGKKPREKFMTHRRFYVRCNMFLQLGICANYGACWHPAGFRCVPYGMEDEKRANDGIYGHVVRVEVY